ncbi:MAG: hypothetical protein AAGD34_05025 [Pseudomonadota bacterium]
MVRRIVAALLAVAALALIIVLWENLSILNGTVLRELRFVVFAAAAFLILTLAERLAGALPGKPDG